MDGRAVEEALALHAQWVAVLRQGWLALMEGAVWAEMHGARPEDALGKVG